MNSLHYYFHEFHAGRQSVVHQFGNDRVAAFAHHRQLERQGKKLSAMQIKKQSRIRVQAA